MTPLPPIGPTAAPGPTAPAPTADAPARRAAEQFERLLLEQLVGELAGPALKSTGGGAYAQLLPQALSDALAQAGGIGLADQLLPGGGTR